MPLTWKMVTLVESGCLRLSYKGAERIVVGNRVIAVMKKLQDFGPPNTAGQPTKKCL